VRPPAVPMWLLIAAIWAPVIVSNTTIASRLYWAALSFVITIWMAAKPTVKGDLPLDHRLGKAIAFLCFGSFAILFGLENFKLLKYIFEPLNSTFEFLFPFMRKLNDLSNVNQDQIVKARTLNTFCMLSASIMLIIAIKNNSKPIEWNLKGRSNFKVVLAILIGPLFMLSAVFGFGEFNPQHFNGKGCLLRAYCYIGDDLAIIGSVLLRMVGIVFGILSMHLMYTKCKGLRRFS
jgi:hypothetical protein